MKLIFNINVEYAKIFVNSLRLRHVDIYFAGIVSSLQLSKNVNVHYARLIFH